MLTQYLQNTLLSLFCVGIYCIVFKAEVEKSPIYFIMLNSCLFSTYLLKRTLKCYIVTSLWISRCCYSKREGRGGEGGNSRGELKVWNISLVKHSAARHHITGSYLYGRRLENHFLLSLATAEPYKLYGYGWRWPTVSGGDVCEEERYGWRLFPMSFSIYSLHESLALKTVSR